LAIFPDTTDNVPLRREDSKAPSLDGEHAVGTDGQKRIVDEGDTGRSVRSGHHGVGRLQMRSYACWEALAAALEIDRASGDPELGYVICPACNRRNGERAHKEKSAKDD